jgi:hypothetical protein
MRLPFLEDLMGIRKTERELGSANSYNLLPYFSGSTLIIWSSFQKHLKKVKMPSSI